MTNMTMTYKLDLERIKVNDRSEYRGQKAILFESYRPNTHTEQQSDCIFSHEVQNGR